MAFGKNRKHSKLGGTTLRAFHFRVETNSTESRKLRRCLDLAWELRNDQAAILQESRAAARQSKLRGEEPHYVDALALKRMVASEQLHPKFCALHSEVRQAISLRVSEGQKRWFDALKKGVRGARPPVPIARKDFRSITYPKYGTAAHVKSGHLHLSKLGEFRLIGWRKMRGRKKSVTLKWKDGHWWAIVMCEVQERDVCRPYSAADVQALPEAGADPGISAVLTDSFGTSYETPKPLKAAHAKLRHIQRDVSRKFEHRKAAHLMTLAAARADGHKAPVASGVVESLRKIPYSKRLKRNIVKLARAHTKVANVRKDVAFKNARRIERTFSRVAVEDHSLQFMVRNRRMAKATADVAIGIQKSALRSALGKGRYFDASNRRVEGGNSQTCLCGESVPKTLKIRWHSCAACGLEMSRDQMSAVICQYETFGSVPARTGRQEETTEEKHSTPGLGVLEQSLAKAVGLLETRRGEGNGASGESQRAEPAKPAKETSAVEPSVKRSSPSKSRKRNTAGETGEEPGVSAGAKTVDLAGLARSRSTEAQVRVHKKTLETRPRRRRPPNRPGSHLLQVGE